MREWVRRVDAHVGITTCCLIALAGALVAPSQDVEMLWASLDETTIRGGFCYKLRPFVPCADYGEDSCAANGDCNDDVCTSEESTFMRKTDPYSPGYIDGLESGADRVSYTENKACMISEECSDTCDYFPVYQEDPDWHCLVAKTERFDLQWSYFVHDTCP